MEQATWTTSSRLLKLGEKIEFAFRLPEGSESGELTVYPRYLEQAKPGKAFIPGGDLSWLRKLPWEKVPLRFTDGKAAVTYQPKETGNYIAEWRIGGESLYRYFSVVRDDYIVLSFSTFWGIESEPTLHGTGIPLDYKLPVDKFQADDPLFIKLLGYNRHYGELIVPEFPDTPDLTQEERTKQYGEGMARVRSLMPDHNDARSIRVVMRHDLDPGYTRTFMQLGVNDHCGLQEANAKPWLGMPEFPYYSSPTDCRKVNQRPNGSVIAHQWDFCGGFHFIGPVAWHYAAAEGDFDAARKCILAGMDEFKGITSMSSHPAFVTPLYDGVMAHPGYPNAQFREGWDAEPMKQFVAKYQKLVAFDLTKKYKLVFARSIDIVDYYRRHFPVTPRTVSVSKTDHLLYDAWWTGGWGNYGVLGTCERIPWYTSMTNVRKMRERALTPEMEPYVPFKDSLSSEFVLIEDQKRSIRFERESPNPIWWCDYTKQEASPNGSSISATATPDVAVIRSQSYDAESGLTIKLGMETAAEFPDYAIALWGLPIGDESRIETSARDFVLARNTDGEVHVVLYFDLKPGVEIELSIHKPRAKAWKY